MDHIGIGVHKKESQLCILTEEGQLTEPRIRTTSERFAAVLGIGRAPASSSKEVLGTFLGPRPRPSSPGAPRGRKPLGRRRRRLTGAAAGPFR
jgi:hypothetical protein